MKRKFAESKSGIALIMVLGLLSIMILMAITFAVTMRITRLGSRNYVDVVKARQLTHVAINRMMDDINTKMGNDIYPQSEYVSTGSSNANILVTSALQYIPDNLSIANDPAWINIENLNNETVGRFSYVAVNVSGYADINLIGYEQRKLGQNTTESQINQFDDITTTNVFVTRRSDQWYVYETLAELKDSVGIRHVDSLTVFSRFPPGYSLPPSLDAEEAIYIGGDANSVSNLSTEVSDQVSDLTPNGVMFHFALVDYMDSDSVPSDLESFATERVPMINEIHFTNTVFSRFTTVIEYQEVLDVQVELWYPFYQEPDDLNFDLIVEVNNNPIGSSPQNLSGGWLGDRYRIFNFQAIGPWSQTAPAANRNYDLKINVEQNGDIVDAVQNIILSGSSLANTPLIAPGVGGPVVTIKETNDPRINWDWSNNVHWVNSVGSPDAENSITIGTGTTDDSWEVYVSNSNELYSIGELGFLLYDATKPWETIRLLDESPPASSQFIDRFTLDSSGKGGGKININSTNNQEVLQAVFKDLEVRSWPGEPPLTTVGNSEADNLASLLESEQTYINLSDLNKLSHDDIKTAVGEAITISDAYAEGVIRDSLGLMGTRQNLFSCILIVQSIKNNAVLAEQKATVLLWRDPYFDGTGHPYIIRHLVWLND